MPDIYHRIALAREMARQLLEPKVLDLPLRSGLFLPGLRRTGKTTVWLEREAPGAIVPQGGTSPASPSS